MKESSAVSHRGGTLDDRCHLCRGRVYLLERHYTATGHLYHRHCYRSYQRSTALHKSKQSSDKENTDKASSGRSTGKIGMGGLAKAPNGTQRLGSSNAPESRLPTTCALSPAHGRRDITAVTSQSPATSSVPTALIKALYTPPSYRQTVTTIESLTPTVSSISTTGGRLGTTSTSSTSVAITAAVTRSDMPTVTAATTKANSCQSLFATARSQYLQRASGLSAPVNTTSQPGTTTSQYLQRASGLSAPVNTTSQSGTTTSQYLHRVGGLSAPVSTTSQPVTSTSKYLQRVGGLSAPVSTTSQPVPSTSKYLQRVGGLNAPATVSMPVCSTEKVGRNIGTFAAARLDSGVVSRYSQPSSSCVAVDRPHTTLSASNTVTSHRIFTCSSLQNVATKTSVTAACVANTEVSWSSGVSSCPLTRVTTSSSDGYVSPFLADRMRGATVTQSAPMMSLHVSSVNSTPVTSHHQVTAVIASRTADQPFRTPQQHSSAKNSVVDGSDNDRAMVSSLLQKLTEARERKQQSRYDSLASVPAVEHHLPVDSVVPVSSTAVSMPANTRMTANSRTGTVSSNKTEWQLEAERRQMARSGVYIDPEKHRKEAAKQHIGQQHGKEDTSTLSEVSRKTLGTEIRLKMNSASSSMDTTAAERMLPAQQVIGSHISDVSPLHLHATRSEQARFKSKKSASITFQLLCIMQS